jgi:hypothetical protein
MLRSILVGVCLMGAIPTIPTLAWSEDIALTSFDELRSQGLLYQRKNYPALALRYLNRAYATETGKLDFKTVYGRGLAAQDLLLIEIAYQMAAEAEALTAEQPSLKRRLNRFRSGLDSLYGGLNLEPAENETNRLGRVFVEPKTGILNRAKRTVFQSIRERFRSKEIEIPRSIYLPHGAYTVNNVPVTIESGKMASARVYLQVERRRQTASSNGLNGWWVAGVGAAATIVSGVGAYFLFTHEDPKQVRVFTPISVQP